MAAAISRAGYVRPAGLRILVPGYPQWAWRQPERAAVFLGSYLAAVGVGLFSWGTPTSFLVLSFAFAMHVLSAADAIRQGAFPGFGKFVPMVSAGAGLGFGCYAPALALASVVAWPGAPFGSLDEGYLVNRWAYRDARPGAGHWVWFDHPESRSRGIGRLLAEEGQGVEWIDGRLHVAGMPVAWTPHSSARRPHDLAMTVPRGYVLVGPAGVPPDDALLGLVLVETRSVLGRAWAQHSPVWRRRLLD